MADLKKSFTNISEVARQRLGITRDEYALCSYIAYRIADPRQRLAGYCGDPKEEIAAFIGISRQGLYKMFERLCKVGLLDAAAITGEWKVTAKWVDSENDCKESLQGSVNKVYTDCKQSLHPTVNKVYTHNKVEKDISKNKEEEKKNASLSSSTSEPKNFPLEAEKETAEGKLPGAPVTVVEVHEQGAPVVTVYEHMTAKQYPTQEPHGEYKRVNIPGELETMKTDAAIREAFTMGRKIPSSNFPEYLEAFRLDVIGRGETYANVKQLRSHFLNWSGSRFEISQRKAQQPKPQTSNGQPAKIRQL